MSGLLVQRVEVDGRQTDVRVAAGTIVEVGPDLGPRGDEAVIDGAGGALIPGLWDHHVHLLAMAAARTSVGVGPPAVRSADDLARTVRRADRDLPPGAWLRGVGYHESVAGPLDRDGLDRLMPTRPLRIQHRSGAQWNLNSAGIERLGLDAVHVDGLERDGRGRLTGRLYGGDQLVRGEAWLEPPDLAGVGAGLVRAGVVGVTDATPTTTPDYFVPIAGARATGALPVRVMVTGAPSLDPTTIPVPLVPGPAKVIVADHDLPLVEDLVAAIGQARRHARPIALHCVTRIALILALTAFDEVGSVDGDRIEHGSIIPDDLIGPLRAHRLTVVTQPGFIAERGDSYADDLDGEELTDLYRVAGLLDAGIRVAGSTDAPFGRADPWLSIRAAVDRRTESGAVIGPLERVEPSRAVALFLGQPTSPGGLRRRVVEGAAADLCLLDGPLDELWPDLGSQHVAATVVGGELVHRRE